MKLNSTLVFIITPALLIAASAQAADVLVLDDGLENKNSMTWPILPGESLDELAAKFYPKNKVMQRHFTAKVLSLNAETMPKLSTKVDFTVPTAVVIPTLKSLSYSAQAIKSARSKSDQNELHMSYNMIDEVRHVPKSLLAEYDYLVTKNKFLKDELEKLNKKLVFLQSKLNDLKLILDKTMSLPKKKAFKNLDAQLIQSNTMPAIKKVQPPNLLSAMLEKVNMNALLAVLGLALVGGLGAYLHKKHRKNASRKLLFDTRQEKVVPEFQDTWQKTEQKIVDTKTGVPLNATTQVEDLHERSILDEARFMMGKNQPENAIEHIKWSIRAQPKSSVNLWLYLLEIFKQLNQKEEFENYAKVMHQTFNVMTPAWEDKNVAMVVAETLEEFPHICEKLSALWPNESAVPYLRNLINDNRNGERSGFGKAVIEEISLLIAMLEQHKNLV
ncbi:MAG: hypothetical protein ACKVOA_05780 [Methylophilaceae bacterium]